ncbi:MAG TPA: sulfatase-like hydrolase/transferase [Acidimicrobiia bacterium]|nr:sulfatase-like hydrolase/transferase [Acidimicrobiia bacterium]
MAVLALTGASWPVLEVLGNNAEFFIARGSTKAEIWQAVVIIAVVAPLLLGALTLLPGRAGTVAADVLIFTLTLALSFLFLRRLPGPDWLAQAMALGLAASAPFLWRRWEGLRSVFRLLTPVPLLAVGLFVFATPTGTNILAEEGAPAGAPARPRHPATVVMLVLDEFPVASLIDPTGDLRANRYPNFARLAEDGTWFRNAMTVQQQTEHSVPAILTGINPDQSLAPLAGQHPNSLFSALARSHRMQVSEAITRLCPVRVCGQVTTGTARERAGAMATDTAIVAGHTLLPAWATRTLPAINRSWGAFGAEVTDFDAIEAFNEASANDPRLKLVALGEQIGADRPDEPTLYFTHVLLPHFPWRLLPTGQSYPLVRERLPGSIDTGWGDNEWLSAQALQRHLLQVQYVDHALGTLIEEMEAAGIYDDALLIVVADHGIALRPDIEHWRRIDDDTVGDVAAIPLFVKAPGVEGGVIDDRRALTIDIVPTIADVLEFRLPWEAEGSSLLGPPPPRVETTTTGPTSSATFGVDGNEKLAVAERNARWFPSGDPFELIPEGAPELGGQAVNDLVEGEADFRAIIERPQWYGEVDPGADSIPVRITGTLVVPPDHEITLGVALNGSIVAMTQSFLDGNVVRFQVMVPPDALKQGSNLIELVWVGADSIVRVPTP